LGVSRSPLREALQQLERDHLVRPDDVNGRRVVTSFGLEDIAELYTVRAALETLAFEQAALRMTQDELTELRRVQAQMEEPRDDGRAWEARDFEADFRFHELVCLAAQMPRLHSQLSTLWVQTWALLQQLHTAGVYPDAGEDAEAFRDHRTLISALETKDPEAAADAVRRHLITRRDHLVDAVERRGGLSATRD
jgi:DNA-binding GntR family transcriptional regulator